MSKRIQWNSERILSISAMLISFITLVIFIYQTNLMSRQNYLSILPYLALSISNSPGTNQFSLAIENHGVGPAIIESVIIRHNGEKHDLADYKNEVLTFLRAVAPQLDSINVVSYSTLDKGMAIPVGMSYNIIKVDQSESDYNLLNNTLNALLAEGLYFEITYRSIQNERWRITNDTEGPEKLD